MLSKSIFLGISNTNWIASLIKSTTVIVADTMPVCVIALGEPSRYRKTDILGNLMSNHF